MKVNGSGTRHAMGKERGGGAGTGGNYRDG